MGVELGGAVGGGEEDLSSVECGESVERGRSA